MITHRGLSHRAMFAVCGVAMLLSACSSSESSIGTATSSSETESMETTRSEQAGPEPTQSAAVLDGTWTTCEQTEIDGDARVEQVELVELSGLAASSRFPEVLWAHNDSGGAAGVYGVGIDGSDGGFFELADKTGIDIEDIALVGDEIYLADIGDNNRRRDSVQIHRFDEPNPNFREPPTEATTVDIVTEATTIDVAYPDEPTDAEALLIDPLSDEVVILSKDLDGDKVATRIYSFEQPSAVDTPDNFDTITMDLVGEIDVAGLESQIADFSLTALLFPGLLTAADISADGRLIAVRTYATVWLYPRAEGQTIAEALVGQPCEGGTAAENQGEALALLPFDPERDEPGTVRYATISEGNNPVINVVSVMLS